MTDKPLYSDLADTIRNNLSVLVQPRPFRIVNDPPLITFIEDADPPFEFTFNTDTRKIVKFVCNGQIYYPA